MRRLVYGSPCDVSKRNCDPGTVAKVLGELALIQSERTAYLTVTGGADCTWFATFAEHVLCLDVAIIDQSGSPIYRSKERKDVMPQITFLTNPEGEPSLHVSQRTSLVSINLRIIRTEAQAPIAMYFCQRSSWSTILRDTFGDDIEKWLTGDFSQYLCISLAFHGSASIIQEWIDSYVDENIEHYVALRKWLGGSSKIELPDVSRELAELLGIPSGEAFVEKAGSILPELRPAIQKHRHKYNLDLGEKLHSLSLEIPEEQFLEQFLLDRYLMTVAVYIKIMMLCEIADDVAPTISGISALYRTISRNMFSDQVNLNHVLSLFTDGISLDVKPQSVTLASCSHGICVHRNGLYDPTEDVPGIATFRVLRGQIVHENNVYTEIFDIERSFERSDEDELWAFESYRYEPKDTHRAVDMLLRQSALNHKLEVGFKVYHEILGAGGTTKHNYLIRLGEMIYDIEHELYFQRSNACKGSHRFATSWAGDPRYPALFEDGMILWLDFEENSVLSSLPNFSRDGKRLYAFIEFGSLIREESGSFGAETANCFFGSYLDIHLLRQYKSRDSARFKSICTSNHNCIACYLGTMNIPLPGFKILLDNMSDDRRSNIFEFPNTFRILGLEGGEKQIRWTAKAERAPEEYQAFLRYRHVDREMLEAITGNKTTL
ncbi:MAG: hypothetical protein LQ351_001341 [Letrouitia transgressa]|nr:MAG: hypothetical protein LQ351_001341 [Letrouitia transgressa]